MHTRHDASTRGPKRRQPHTNHTPLGYMGGKRAGVRATLSINKVRRYAGREGIEGVGRGKHTPHRASLSGAGGRVGPAAPVCGRERERGEEEKREPGPTHTGKKRKRQGALTHARTRVVASLGLFGLVCVGRPSCSLPCSYVSVTLPTNDDGEFSRAEVVCPCIISRVVVWSIDFIRRPSAPTNTHHSLTCTHKHISIPPPPPQARPSTTGAAAGQIHLSISTSRRPTPRQIGLGDDEWPMLRALSGGGGGGGRGGSNGKDERDGQVSCLGGAAAGVFACCWGRLRCS